MVIKLFQRDQFVDWNLPDGHILRFCKITAVKDCETGYRYDFTIGNIKVYDVSQDLLTDSSDRPYKITKSELE